jgi:hypothetical protein
MYTGKSRRFFFNTKPTLRANLYRKSQAAKNQGNNVTLILKRGNSRAYLLARLRRDGATDARKRQLAEQVSAGSMKRRRCGPLS